MTQTQPSLLATLVLPVAQALRIAGVDPMAVFEEAGIDMACAANPDWRVPRDRFADLLARSIEATGDEAFGLAAAEQLQPQVLQGLGLAWLASDTVYDGLRRVARFARFVSTGAVLELSEEDGYVHATLHGALAPPDGREYATLDYAVGVLVRMSQLTLGEYLAPLAVNLERPLPANPARWEYMLASRVTFGSERTRVSWPRSDIEQPLATGDPELARINDERISAYLQNFLARSVARRVADFILHALPDGAPAQGDVARALHLSERTLQRRLQEEGTSFSALLRDARLELARRYLREQRRSVLETAYLLGFSEPSTFSRAFKGWTGIAPAAYRDAVADGA